MATNNSNNLIMRLEKEQRSLKKTIKRTDDMFWKVINTIKDIIEMKLKDIEFTTDESEVYDAIEIYTEGSDEYNDCDGNLRVLVYDLSYNDIVNITEYFRENYQLIEQ